MMQCNYVAVFAAHTMTLPRDESTIRVYEGDRVSAVLASDPTELLHAADRDVALRALLLDGIFGSPDPRSFEEKLHQEMAAVTARRQRAAGSAPYLVVTVALEVEVSLRGRHKDLRGFSLYFNAVDKGIVRAQVRPQVDRVLAAIIVASESDPRFDCLSESIYLTSGEGRVVYSATPSVRAANLLVRTLPKDLANLVSRYMSVTRARSSPDLTTVYSLLRAAVDGQTEPLRAFVAAWSALEIFVNKVFGTYDDIWFDLLTRGRTATEIAPLPRIRGVLKGKYGLMDKFSVIAVVLDSEGADTDIPVFGELKKTRDGLFHRGVREQASLPVQRVIVLTQKYLRLHLERSASTAS